MGGAPQAKKNMVFQISIFKFQKIIFRGGPGGCLSQVRKYGGGWGGVGSPQNLTTNSLGGRNFNDLTPMV